MSKIRSLSVELLRLTIFWQMSDVTTVQGVFTLQTYTTSETYSS